MRRKEKKEEEDDDEKCNRRKKKQKIQYGLSAELYGPKSLYLNCLYFTQHSAYIG